MVIEVKILQRQMSADSTYMKKIDYIFYKEAEIREQVLELKKKVAHNEIRNASSLSDPTAAEAIRNIMPVTAVVIDERILKYPEHWLEVVDLTKKQCRKWGETFYGILRGRYSGEDFKETCARFSISVDFYYRTLEKIRNYAALWAAWFHLISF